MEMDYKLAFEMAPVGLVISRNRTMVDCNHQVCEMFAISRELMIGQSFQILYPSADEYERLGARMAPILNAKGHYSDNRIMKRAMAASGAMSAAARWTETTPRLRHLEL
jgi:PAS domain S-box-containing protein